MLVTASVKQFQMNDCEHVKNICLYQTKLSARNEKSLIITTRNVKRTITYTNYPVLNITAVTRKTDIVYEVQLDLGIRIYQRW